MWAVVAFSTDDFVSAANCAGVTASPDWKAVGSSVASPFPSSVPQAANETSSSGALTTAAMTVALGLLWAASPLWTWWASRPRSLRADAALPAAAHAYLEGVARDTWSYFERCVNADENHLPPDNLQTLPHEMLAHRT